MRFLALEREVVGAAAEDFRPLLRAEALRVWELYQATIVREMYFDSQRHTAVLLLECADEAAAREALGTLPLAQAGLITFDIIPLVPYPGFARLFETG
jgi:hypothetical protein